MLLKELIFHVPISQFVRKVARFCPLYLSGFIMSDNNIDPVIIVAQTAHHTPTLMSRHGPNVSIWVCRPTSIRNFEYSPSPFSEPGSSVGTATDYGLDSPGSNPGGDEIFRPPDRLWGPPGSLPGVKCGRGVLLTTHPLLVPRSWKSRAIPLPTLWAIPDL